MKRKPLTGRKGAALVEYVLLVGLIGIVLISVVLSLGEKITGAYNTTNTALLQQATENTDPPDDDILPPNPNPVPDPDWSSDLSNLDFPEMPDLLNSVQDYYTDAYLDFEMISSARYTDLLEQALSTASPPADWATSVIWTGIEEGYSGFMDDVNLGSFNEWRFTTTGFTHNIGPLNGWGRGVSRITECLNPPQLVYLKLTGHASISGQPEPGRTPIELFVNLSPNPCPIVPDADVLVSLQVDHTDGRIINFGQVMNAEDPSSIDWTNASWTGEIQYWNPHTRFRNYQQDEFSMRFNVVSPGPAWVFVDDPLTTDCIESGVDATLNLAGELPTGQIGLLVLNFSASGDGTSCWPVDEPFSPG